MVLRRPHRLDQRVHRVVRERRDAQRRDAAPRRTLHQLAQRVVSSGADDRAQDAAVDEGAVRGVLCLALPGTDADALHLFAPVHVRGHRRLPSGALGFVLDARSGRVDELEHEPALVRAFLLLRLERVLDHAHDVRGIVRVDRPRARRPDGSKRVENREALRLRLVKVQAAAVNLGDSLARVLAGPVDDRGGAHAVGARRARVRDGVAAPTEDPQLPPRIRNGDGQLAAKHPAVRRAVRVEADVLPLDRQRGAHVLVRLLREFHGLAVRAQGVALRQERPPGSGLGWDDVIFSRSRFTAAGAAASCAAPVGVTLPLGARAATAAAATAATAATAAATAAPAAAPAASSPRVDGASAAPPASSSSRRIVAGAPASSSSRGRVAALLGGSRPRGAARVTVGADDHRRAKARGDRPRVAERRAGTREECGRE